MGVWGVVALSIATAEAEPTVWVPSVYKTVPRAYEAKMKPKTPEISKAPSHFSEKARQLWKSIHAEYELASESAELLRVALENLDLADKARELLRTLGAHQE
jgi:hypothetical protein